MLPEFLRALHILGVILWIGGTVTAALSVAYATRETAAQVASVARRALLVVATPGLLLAWLAGLAMLVPNFSATYASAGWMHGKLLLAVVVSALAGMVVGRLRKTAAGTIDHVPGKLRLFAFLTLGLAIVVVFLVQMRPG
jgi:putative membrane protein